MTEYYWNALLKGVLEGFTEFLPISSTGHLILVRDLLPLTGDAQRADRLDDLFDIVIQFPAILAIVVLYWSRIWVSVRDLTSRMEPQRFWTGIVVAFLPAAAVGVKFHKQIEESLEKPVPVALALILGGLVLILVEFRKTTDRITQAEQVPIWTALSIGLFQCVALIPGVSRSGATIVGGRLSGLTRSAAAEFSFFLALPTMGGAFVYKMCQSYRDVNWSTDGTIILIGSVASFLTAIAVVAWFVRFLQKHSLAVFGWYRVVLGIVVLIVYFTPALRQMFFR